MTWGKNSRSVLRIRERGRREEGQRLGNIIDDEGGRLAGLLAARQKSGTELEAIAMNENIQVIEGGITKLQVDQSPML
jgi:hypothetical protein